MPAPRVGQFREGDKSIDIVLRQPLDERDSLTDLADGYLPTASGGSIPMTQLIKPSLVWEPGVMWRENRDYAITVQGDIVEGLQGATVTAELLPALRGTGSPMGGQRTDRLPDRGGRCGGGEQQGLGIDRGRRSDHALHHVHAADAAAAQLQPRALLVFLTGPMGIAGVAGALLLFDRPFGFVALLGVIALMGMIQRNSVILIDQIEQDRAVGIHPWEAIVESAVRRLRPIVLTAAAAVLAMIPLSRSVFWGPMAVAIMGGLIVATVLTLLALPAMYAAWYRVRRDPLAAG